MEDKMRTTTVIAKDTSSAMDDIISKLGGIGATVKMMLGVFAVIGIA